ncbi:MAG: hypothetical protein IAF38_07690, partial [Bacteroidia bacterium]|nr:hypothetical protein [Bacteroidia bacterium]
AGIHPVLLYLFPGLVFYSGYLILGHHFSGRGDFSKNLIPIFCGLVFTAVGLIYIYFSYPEFTMTHAAIVTCLSYFANFFTALFIFYKDASLGWRDFLPSGTDINFIKEELKRKKE